MHNIANYWEAIDYINGLIAAYRDAQAQAKGLWGPISEAHESKIARCRNQIRTAIFCHRENIFEGIY